MDPATGEITDTITLQINPTQLTRSLKVQGAGGEGGDRSEAMRLTGPPVETIQLEAELDATDKLEDPKRNQDAVVFGLRPELAALERIVYPELATLIKNNELAEAGMLEILPAEAPLTLFSWGINRLLPVLITELNIVEEAFDQKLNPIRAKVTLGLRVLSVNDLPFNHAGSSHYLGHHGFLELVNPLARVLKAAGAAVAAGPPRRSV